MTWSIGRRVLARWDDGFWYGAVVESIAGSEIGVLFDDGVRQTVSAERLVAEDAPAAGGPPDGARVQAQWSDAGWYPAHVEERRGTLARIRWDDGAIRWVEASSIRADEPTVALAPQLPPRDAAAEALDAERVAAAWKRIRTWRVQNDPDSPGGPVLPMHLRPEGMDDSAVNSIARTFGELPADLVAMLKSGAPISEFVAYPWRVMSAAQIIEEYQYRVGSRAARFGWYDDRVQDADWHDRWLPFATDHGGSKLIFDLAPGSAGAVGQILEIYPGDRKVVASGLAELLEAFALRLENGAFRVNTNYQLEPA